ncbi:MAG: hypothetical protein Q4F35_07325 [Akkermansia sp.]|nr:hypothetical protein [Akkermansia sp.]
MRTAVKVRAEQTVGYRFSNSAFENAGTAHVTLNHADSDLRALYATTASVTVQNHSAFYLRLSDEGCLNYRKIRTFALTTY